MDKGLPSSVQDAALAPRSPSPPSRLRRLCLAGALIYIAFQLTYYLDWRSSEHANVPLHASEILDRCRLLDVKPGPPPDFNLRTQSDRCVPGTPPTLIKNASIWTGRVNGLEVLEGDLLFDKGIIQQVGIVDSGLLIAYDNLEIVDAQGAWVSPGIVDLHSHIGVNLSPGFRGTNDGNSYKGPILPWLRALDALNTHNDAYKLSISGGVTTALVLPGSANAIGGQGIVIKLRPTKDHAPTGLLLENPYSTNGSEYDPSVARRWKQIKHACGENPARVYADTRMDTIWAFRKAYEQARTIKVAQDDYCSKVVAGQWNSLGNFPEDLQWEALVDVLRGHVKVQTHCYETVDLDDLVRITNEFKFPIAAFHHAHETYLVPDTLKSAYGTPPAIALFATNARYKRESYRGSEFAPKILADNGLQVVMKSDHPVLDSRFLLYEAQQAHYYGLAANLALASVTSAPAVVMGMEHRVGYLKTGYDADIVLWDSHPLALGATPKQVWIDGIAQLDAPYSSPKPVASQDVPQTPDFDREAEDVLEYVGLAPLEPTPSRARTVVFTNVSSVLIREAGSIREALAAQNAAGVVVARDGRMVCSGAAHSCADLVLAGDAQFVDLAGGAIVPGLVSYGGPLGLGEIRSEASTTDGPVFDPLSQTMPALIGGDSAVISALDGLQYCTRDALIAYRAGVTTGIVAPLSLGFLSGLSTVFSLSARHRLEKGAVIQDVAALHFNIYYGGSTSVSTQITALRTLLLSGTQGPLAHWIGRVKKGEIPLVIDVESADAIASLIQLKQQVEADVGRPIKMTITGASEAHLLAKEIGDAGVGVVITAPRPHPKAWDRRRILPGLPLSETNAVSMLLAHNVTVGFGVRESWMARNTRWDVAWAALETGGEISKADALALASIKIETLLGVQVDDFESDLVATRGGDLLEFSGKVVGVISPRRGVVDLI